MLPSSLSKLFIAVRSPNLVHQHWGDKETPECPNHFDWDCSCLTLISETHFKWEYSIQLAHEMFFWFHLIVFWKWSHLAAVGFDPDKLLVLATFSWLGPGFIYHITTQQERLSSHRITVIGKCLFWNIVAYAILWIDQSVLFHARREIEQRRWFDWLRSITEKFHALLNKGPLTAAVNSKSSSLWSTLGMTFRSRMQKQNSITKSFQSWAWNIPFITI